MDGAGNNRAFRVQKISQGLTYVPDGFLSDGLGFGAWVNPRFCEPYKGATSVIDAHYESAI